MTVENFRRFPEFLDPLAIGYISFVTCDYCTRAERLLSSEPLKPEAAGYVLIPTGWQVEPDVKCPTHRAMMEATT